MQHCQSLSVHYGLMSHKLYRRLERMQIDEEEEFSLGYDHRHIRVSLETVFLTVMRPKQDKKIC